MGSLLAMGMTAVAEEPTFTSSLTAPEPAKAKPAKNAKAGGLATQRKSSRARTRRR